jgi:hypothetical protein
MKVEELKEWLKYYEEGVVTENELEMSIFNRELRTYLERIEKDKCATGNFSCGAFHGPLKNYYGLVDHNSQTTVFYPLTFKYIIRMYWNRLMRRFGWHRYTKVW